MLQRFSISCLGVLLLVACGGGQAQDPPGVVNQDPTTNPNRPTIGWQNPATPSQRPTPPPQGVVIAVGPIDTSAGGSGAQGGSDNNGGGPTGNGGSGDPGPSGDCTPSNSCVNCDFNNCLTTCQCFVKAGTSIDCAQTCANN